MSRAIAVFVKTPGLSPLKTRLAKTIGDKNALQFYRMALETVRQNIVGLPDTVSYWAVAEEKARSDRQWSDLPCLYTGEGDLGRRQYNIYSMLRLVHDRILLIGADTPQLSPVIINQAFEVLDSSEYVLGPANDGGYYLFGARVAMAREIWDGISWSVETTRAELEQKLPTQPAYLPFLTDVDREEDLQAILNEMPEKISSHQQILLEWIGKKYD